MSGNTRQQRKTRVGGRGGREQEAQTPALSRRKQPPVRLFSSRPPSAANPKSALATTHRPPPLLERGDLRSLLALGSGGARSGPRTPAERRRGRSCALRARELEPAVTVVPLPPRPAAALSVIGGAYDISPGRGPSSSSTWRASGMRVPCLVSATFFPTKTSGNVVPSGIAICERVSSIVRTVSLLSLTWHNTQ